VTNISRFALQPGEVREHRWIVGVPFAIPSMLLEPIVEIELVGSVELHHRCRCERFVIDPMGTACRARRAIVLVARAADGGRPEQPFAADSGRDRRQAVGLAFGEQALELRRLRRGHALWGRRTARGRARHPRR
jgi:hypothetical protein